MPKRKKPLFEHVSRPLLPWPAYRRRLIKAALSALLLIVVSLILGMVGFHSLVSLSWIDAFLNASMLLSGMGPLAEPHSTAGKLFAGFYALYSGFVALIAAAVLAAPVLHRFMHRFHLEKGADGE